MELKAALVGCGAMSRAWLQAAAKIPDLRIVGLADLDLERARARAAEFALTTPSSPTDVRTLLAAIQPDLLFDVVVPSARHARGLRRPCGRLSCVERKADGRELADAHDIVARAKAADRIHAVVQNRRYLPASAALRARCAPARSARSPASTPISSSRRTSAVSARRWIMCCCSIWRSTASTPCAA